MARMTQELGKVTDVNGKLDLEKYPIGKMLFIYPWHVSIQIVGQHENCLVYKDILYYYYNHNPAATATTTTTTTTTTTITTTTTNTHITTGNTVTPSTTRR